MIAGWRKLGGPKGLLPHLKSKVKSSLVVVVEIDVELPGMMVEAEMIVY